jgi:hypothetical protein
VRLVHQAKKVAVVPARRPHRDMSAALGRRFRVPVANRFQLTSDGVARKPLLPAFGHSEHDRHAYRNDLADQRIKIANRQQKMVLFNRGQGAGGGYWQEYGSDRKPSSRKSSKHSPGASVVEKSTHQMTSVAGNSKHAATLRNSQVPSIDMNRTMPNFKAERSMHPTDRSEPRRTDAQLQQDSVFSQEPNRRGGGSRIKERLSPIRLDLLKGDQTRAGLEA